MKLALLSVGKTRVPFVSDGLQFYSERIRKYCTWELLETIDVKHLADQHAMVATESERVLKQLQPSDHVVLLDEKGVLHTSISFAKNISKIADKGTARRIVFVIAGAYGASAVLKNRADEIWSLSALTFPHQLVRLVLAEQIYRALTIMRNEPYHHEG